MDKYESVGANTAEIESLIFEPYSIGAFFIISAVGFILVLLTVFVLEHFFKRSIEQIKESFPLKRIFIPISEVGLSTGAIIIGVSLGIAFNYATLATWSDQHDITKSTVTIALAVILISWPIYWQQRSILVIGKIDNGVFNLMGLGYIAVLGYMIYLANFYWFVAISSFGCIVTSLAYYYLVFKKRSLMNI